MKRAPKNSATLSSPEIEDLPEVQEHALAAEGVPHDADAGGGINALLTTTPSVGAEESTTPSAAPAEGIASPSGDLWDPALHERPRRLNSKGGWAKLRGGKKGGRESLALPPAQKAQPAGEDVGAAERTRVASAAAAADDAAKTAQLAATGEGCAALTFGIAESIGGPEYAPREGEFAAVSGAYAAYLRSKDLIDIPPGLALAIVLTSVFAKRPSLWKRGKTLFYRYVLGRDADAPPVAGEHGAA